MIVISKDVKLVGFDEFDGFTVNKVRETADNIANKYSKMFGDNSLLEFRIMVDKVREREKHTDYEIKVLFDTTNGHFHAAKTGWKILNVVDEVLTEIERQVLKKKEKTKDHRRHPDNV